MRMAAVLAAAAFAAAVQPQPLAAAPARASRQAVRAGMPKAALTASNPFRRSPYVGALVFDFDTGRTLFSDRADAKAYPASVTKLMTAFLVLDDVKAGRMSLDDRVVASPTRTKLDVHLRQASNIGLKPGEALSVRELLETMLVRSANDSAVFLAEKCSGSVEAFVARMNAKARSLGMFSTSYSNPNGLPPLPSAKERKFNVSTCSDLAKLAKALLAEHPGILKFTSVKVCTLKHPSAGVLKFINHNNLLAKDKWKIVNPDGTEAVDGLKTGYIDAGGSSIIATAKRGGRRAVAIVLGSSSAPERDDATRRLLEDALDAMTL